MEKSLKIAQSYLDDGDLDNAYRIANKALSTDPNDVEWLQMMSYIMLQSEKFPIAYSLAKRVTELRPDRSQGWLNYGMAARELWRFKEARRAYKRGVNMAKTPDEKAMMYVNTGSLCVDMGDYKAGEDYSRLALAHNPDSIKAKANLGFAELGQGKDGWSNYRACIGTDWRPHLRYNKEPFWDGESQGTICIYGEQGLGDMLCFGGLLRPMIEWCAENDSHLIVDIDPRLLNTFKRSYPGVEIHPTLGESRVRWDTKRIDYSLPMGQLAEYFPIDKTPWIVPDSERVLQWRALFESKGKPAIGVAWTGGIPKTGDHYRKVTIEQLQPLFEAVDAHWVSLQYKPAGECYPVTEYARATLVRNYDDTIGMVAALDAVVGVPTTVIHAAGCLGVRTIAMDAPIRCWKFASGVPFHPVTQIPYNTDWDQTIRDTASHLEDLCLEYLSDSTQDSPLPITSVNSRSSKTPQSLSA